MEKGVRKTLASLAASVITRESGVGIIGGIRSDIYQAGPADIDLEERN